MDIYHIIEIDGYKVRYFDAGKGVPVVLLHGFCLSSVSFETIVPALAQDFRVIGPDLPGFGGSDIIPGMHDMLRTANWLDRFVERLGLEQFILVGHSMGGYIALAYAQDFAEKLKGLGLFHSSSAPDDDTAISERNKAIDFVSTYGVGPYISNFSKSLFFAENQDLEERIRDIGMHSSKEAIIAYAQAMRDRPDRTSILKELDIPILFLIGRNDHKIPLTKIRDQFMLPKNAVKSLLEFAGHMGMYEAPTSTRAALRNFFKFAMQSSSANGAPE